MGGYVSGCVVGETEKKTNLALVTCIDECDKPTRLHPESAPHSLPNLRQDKNNIPTES